MGKRKITCNNHSCKHHTDGGCDTCITLDGSGKCESFEKGFAYYFHIVWDALDNKNFIDMVEIRMNPELRIGLFYVTDCYDLGFSEMEWGTCRMIMLKDGKEGKPLKYEEIIEREMNMEKFSKHLENFNNGIMPQMQREQDAAGQLYKRLDALDAQIFECEMEYKEIVTALAGENGRNEHGNRIQRHGGIEQKQQGRD